MVMDDEARDLVQRMLVVLRPIGHPTNATNSPALASAVDALIAEGTAALAVATAPSAAQASS